MQERNSRGVALVRGFGLALVLALLGAAVLVVPYGSAANDRSASPSDASVARASDRLDRAADAVATHETETGVADPAADAADAQNRLDSLQDERDRAVASGDPAASVLERQVATAQQQAFDLDAVARRRAELVGARGDAADALAAVSRERSVGNVDPGTDAWPVWRVGLAGLLFGGALGVTVLMLVRSRRPRRRTARPSAPPPVADAEPESDPAPRLSLDEIELRLAALEPDELRDA